MWPGPPRQIDGSDQIARVAGLPLFWPIRRLPTRKKCGSERHVALEATARLDPPSPSPCPTCPNSERCSGAELGCTALELFENTRRYSVAPRQPNHETWLRLYGPDD
jgi:hypothetical protein